eukprot:610071_1
MEQAQFQGPTDLLSLVRKREKTLQYIKKGHRGNHHWLNTAKLTTEMIHKRKDKKTIEQWFVLGMSLGSLLDFSHGSQIVRSFLQLMEEFDYFMSNNSAKNMRLILNAKPLRSAEDGSPDESPIRPCLKKSQNGKIFFESPKPLHTMKKSNESHNSRLPAKLRNQRKPDKNTTLANIVDRSKLQWAMHEILS